MESRRKRSRSQMLKWGCYILLLVVCTVVQTTPGLFQWLLPLGLAVSSLEGEFAGAIFGAVCGLMWDYTAGRTVGMLALEMMILCFGVSVIVQLYLKDTPSNFVLLAVGGALLVLALELLLLCFAVSAVMQLYFKNSAANFALIASAAALLVLTLDWLFFYYMPGYAGAGERFLWVVLPSALMTAPGSWLLHRAVQRISAEFKIDNGVV